MVTQRLADRRELVYIWNDWLGITHRGIWVWAVVYVLTLY